MAKILPPTLNATVDSSNGMSSVACANDRQYSLTSSIFIGSLKMITNRYFKAGSYALFDCSRKVIDKILFMYNKCLYNALPATISGRLPIDKRDVKLFSMDHFILSLPPDDVRPSCFPPRAALIEISACELAMKLRKSNFNFLRSISDVDDELAVIFVLRPDIFTSEDEDAFTNVVTAVTPVADMLAPDEVFMFISEPWNPSTSISEPEDADRCIRFAMILLIEASEPDDVWIVVWSALIFFISNSAPELNWLLKVVHMILRVSTSLPDEPDISTTFASMSKVFISPPEDADSDRSLLLCFPTIFTSAPELAEMLSTQGAVSSTVTSALDIFLIAGDIVTYRPFPRFSTTT